MGGRIFSEEVNTKTAFVLLDFLLMHNDSSIPFINAFFCCAKTTEGKCMSLLGFISISHPEEEALSSLNVKGK